MSVYSPQVETNPTDPEIMVRMSLGWKWEDVSLPLSSTSQRKNAGTPQEKNQHQTSPSEEGKKEARDGMPSSSSIHSVSSSSSAGGKKEEENHETKRETAVSGNGDYLREDQTIRKVLAKYREMNKTLSFVLPVGAFCLFKNLLRLSGNQLFCLVGDKGYPTADEFTGERDPHIAIHGSISFMLNLHSIRLYFDALGDQDGEEARAEEEEEEEGKEKERCSQDQQDSRDRNNAGEEVDDKKKERTGGEEEDKKKRGFSMYTPYRDTFQITGLWYCGEKKFFPRSQAAFLDDLEDMTPDGLIQWQRSCQETFHNAGEYATGTETH